MRRSVVSTAQDAQEFSVQAHNLNRIFTFIRGKREIAINNIEEFLDFCKWYWSDFQAMLHPNTRPRYEIQFAERKPLKGLIGYSECQHFYTRKFSGAMKSAHCREHNSNETGWMEVHLEKWRDRRSTAKPFWSGAHSASQPWHNIIFHSLGASGMSCNYICF